VNPREGDHKNELCTACMNGGLIEWLGSDGQLQANLCNHGGRAKAITRKEHKAFMDRIISEVMQTRNKTLKLRGVA
jgi:hypothetical protein